MAPEFKTVLGMPAGAYTFRVKTVVGERASGWAVLDVEVVETRTHDAQPLPQTPVIRP